MRSTRTRARTGLLVAALIFVAIGIGVVLGGQRLIGDSRGVAHSTAVVSQIQEFEARLRDAEAAQRGYVLTADVTYLAEYRNAGSVLPGLSGQLSRRVADNPAQARRAAALAASVRERTRLLEQTLESYRVGGLPAAQAMIGRENNDVSAAIRRQAADMVAAERALLAQRADSTGASARTLRVLALLGIPLGLVVILAVYALLVGEIRERARAESASAEANDRLRVGVDALERSSADLQALSRYGGMLQSCAGPAEALRLTSRMLSTLLPGTAGTVYHMRDSKDRAERKVQWGEHRAACPDMLPPESCWALRRGQTHLVSGARDAPCAHAGMPGHDRVAIACIPLSAQGVQLGLLYLTDDDAGFLEHITIVEAVAEQLSMALSNLYLQERLRVQSIREPLTGLYNRRYLEESTRRELARCARRRLPLALMMLDIDHFKAFNDVHGHAGGDAVLKAFGKVLQGLSRIEDIACRYGGEEFTLIMPEADMQVAWKRAEAVRAAVEDMRVEHLGQVLPPLTVSIGVASFPEDGDTPELLLRAADAALYRAKRNGRNRTEHATTPHDQPPVDAADTPPGPA